MSKPLVILGLLLSFLAQPLHAQEAKGDGKKYDFFENDPDNIKDEEYYEIVDPPTKTLIYAGAATALVGGALVALAPSLTSDENVSKIYQGVGLGVASVGLGVLGFGIYQQVSYSGLEDYEEEGEETAANPLSSKTFFVTYRIPL